MRHASCSILLLAMLSVLCNPAAWAAGQTRPGLWEMTVKSDAMKEMPKIPPDQMEQMRRMGIAMPQMHNGGLVTKVCISKAMAERDHPPGMADKESGCQTKNMQRSSSGYAMDVVCNGPAMKGEGKARGTFAGNDSFTSTYDFNGTMHGQPIRQHHETSGKWLGADCGDVKPIDALMPKK